MSKKLQYPSRKKGITCILARKLIVDNNRAGGETDYYYYWMKCGIIIITLLCAGQSAPSLF